jgi:YaiO family outer membrane protein
VEGAGDWLRFGQAVTRRWGDGTRLSLGLTQTRRFGAWDAGLDAGVTLRPSRRVVLTLEGAVIPDADVLEDLQAGARVAVPVGALVPSLGYRFQSFADGDAHTVSPRLAWYRGPWLVTGEVRVIRSAVETVNLAGIGRVRRRIGGGWQLRIGLAAGEEDFLVGPPGEQELRTLRTRSVFGGVERELSPAWSVRVDLSAVDSDPRLDRYGGSVSVTRSF